MATYNKRGYKPKTKPDTDDSNLDGYDAAAANESATAEVFETLDVSANRAEEWFERNQKTILYTLGAIAILAIIGFLVKLFVLDPKQDEAVNEVTQANAFYEQAVNAAGTQQDSLYNLALNGGEGKFGLLKIADEYSGTGAGNLANYQIGMAYLNLGGKNYQKAIDYLTKYDGGDSVLAAMAQAGIGDALVNANQSGDAVSFYVKASEISANSFTTPKFLLKAAQAAMGAKKNSDAIAYLTTIVEEYPTSEEISVAKTLLGQAEAIK
jgi:tetratricopeptide (TPR) repeat protein